MTKTSIISILLSCLFFNSCQWDGFKSDDSDNDILKFKDLRKAKAYEYGENLIQEIALWEKEHGFTYVSEPVLLNNIKMNTTLYKSEESIRFYIHIDLSKYTEDYPIVKERGYADGNEADNLNIELTIKNNKNNQTFTISKQENIFANNVVLELNLTPNELRKIEVGITNLTVDLKAEFVTFFGFRSKIYPVEAKMNIRYKIPQYYKTVLYFKHLILDVEKTKMKLGDNDFSNNTPETGIEISYDGNTLMKDYKKNSWSYKKKHKIDVYHTDTDRFLDIEIFDKDYGFNQNDRITDTTINMKDFEGRNYINIPMKYVEELLIYCQFKGEAN